MAGHSKWANIKHRKERADQKKGKIFSKLIKEIIVAVKQGGADPTTNTKLRGIIQKAKAANLPNENIERNIKKASNADQSNYHETIYEIYGVGSVGIIVEGLTDNKNRMASEIRIAINKCGGTIATPGAVSYNFEKKGVIQILSDQKEELFLDAIDAGAEEFDSSEDQCMITTAADQLMKVKEELDQKGYISTGATIEMIPKLLVQCSKEDQDKNLTLIEWLENLDDVDSVYHNMDLS